MSSSVEVVSVDVELWAAAVVTESAWQDDVGTTPVS